MPSMVDDATLDLEFAYTLWDDSCLDINSLHYRCRRPRGHNDEHAAGFGAQRIRWSQQEPDNLDAPLTMITP